MAEPFSDDRGEQVLAGVLLHVIMATGPADPTVDLAGAEGFRQQVSNPIVLVHDIRDRDAVEGAGVEWLAT